MNKEIDIEIYTDGGCNPNPGEGGWGVVIIYNGTQTQIKSEDYYLSGYNKNTTNNQMELTAVIEALKFINNTNGIKKNIVVYTDSKYVKNGITKWIKNWKFNNWKTSSKKPVKNKDLWLDLDNHRQVHNVQFEWVRGHSDNVYNNKADELATNAIVNKGNEDFNNNNRKKMSKVLKKIMSKIEVFPLFLVYKNNENKQKYSVLTENIKNFNIYEDNNSTYSLYIYLKDTKVISINYPTKKEVEEDFYKIAKIGITNKEFENGN